MSRCAISNTFSDTSKVKVTHSRSNVKITSKMPSGRRNTFQGNNFFELIFAISLNAYLFIEKKNAMFRETGRFRENDVAKVANPHLIETLPLYLSQAL